MSEKALLEKEEVCAPLAFFTEQRIFVCSLTSLVSSLLFVLHFFYFKERNKIRGRRGKAVAYMDNQIRTIISILQQHDKSITFGQLFQEVWHKLLSLYLFGVSDNLDFFLVLISCFQT